MGIFRFLKELFAEPIMVEDIYIPKPYQKVDDTTDDGWYDFDENNPPAGVVLGACDTYDCGWCQDTVWWNFDEKCWMLTGPLENSYAHLPYTKWRKLPNDPT